MIIMDDSVPGLKSFLSRLGRNSATRQLMLSWIVAFLMHSGRMGAVRAAGAVRTEPRHRAQLSRFLRRQFWERLHPLQTLRNAVLASLPLTGRAIFCIDQTLCGRQGNKTPNTYSTGNRKRRPRKGRRYSKYKHARKSCHCFVQGLLILPNGMRIPFSKSYYTKAYCESRKMAYRTQTEIAAELIRELPLPEGADLVVLGDTAFDAESIRDACEQRGCLWIVPVNPERVLAGAKPRPKIRSLIAGFKAKDFEELRLFADRGRYASYRRVSAWRQGPGKRPRTFYVHGETRNVHSVGKALLVFSTRQEPLQGKAVDVQKILMTNACKLSAREVVELYDLRWQIELYFKELKSTLGFAQYQLRDFAAVEAWVQLALTTFLFLEWYRHRQLARSDLTPRERQRWQCQRTHGLCLALRQVAESQDLQILAERARTKHGIRRMKAALKKATPAEYRI
jgi:hypothetical protein